MGVTYPAASLDPMAIPSSPPVPVAIAPASAVTSPSFTTTNGMPFHSACSSRKSPRTRASNAAGGTERKSDAARTSLST